MAEMARSLMDYAAPPVAQRGVTGSPAQPMSLMDYLSDLDLLNILNGTGIPERLALVNETLNPLAAIPRAQAASQEIFAPDRTAMQRTASTGDMLSEVAGVVAPIAASTRVGVPAATALVEGLLGGSPATQAASDAARRFLANESGALPLIGGGTAGPTQEAKQAAENAFAAARQAYENNPVNARGAQIIDMLTSGRADEITDEMLDMGDPVLNANLNQYLYRNYDLPMDEASRMQRAQEMYSDAAKRAQNNEFASVVGLRTDTDPNGWQKPSRVWIEGYPTDDVLRGVAVTDMRQRPDQAFAAHGLGGERNYSTQDYTSFDPERRYLSLMYGDSASEGADAYEQVIPSALNMLQRDRITARFDPRLSHLRNLSAGIAPFGLLALQPNEEQY